MNATPAPSSEPSTEVIEGGALRLTWISGAVAGVAALITVFDNSVTTMFGSDVSDGVRASVLIAIIAAWALIAVADLLARAIATAGSLRGPAAAPQLITLPGALKLKLTEGVDQGGWLGGALKVEKPGEEAQLLVVKAGQPPQWVAISKVIAR